MNLYHLKTFYNVAKHGSLTRAAEVMCITQPAVTKQIQKLQDYYNLKLLNPSGKRVVLTDAGQVLYSIAEKIFELESQAEASIRDFQQLRSGSIAILSSESFGAYYLPAVIAAFGERFPGICLSVNILPNDEVVENTSRLANDLGFISYCVEHPKLVVREILEDALILIVPPGHPFASRQALEPRELEGQPLIMHERGSATRMIVDDFFRKNGLRVAVRCELSNNESIKRLVEGGLALSIISKNVAQRELESGRLAAVRLKDSSLRRKYYLVHHRDKYFSKALQGLVDITLAWSAAYSGSLPS